MSKNGKFEQRESQEDIMLNIVDAYRDDINLLIEAGVGIGKSLSYLIPGILLSYYSGKPLVVATSSIQLTEQLYEDVKLASEILKMPVDKVVGKGKSNYPCIDRVSQLYARTGEYKYEEYLSNIDVEVDKQNPKDIRLSDWNNIAVENCKFGNCKFYSECGYYLIRNKLKEGNHFNIEYKKNPKVIIVNQDLLISHIFKYNDTRNPIIFPDHCLLVIDEIHNMEEKSRNALTKEIDSKKSKDILKECQEIIYQVTYDNDVFALFDKCIKSVDKMFDKLNKDLIFETNKPEYEGNFEKLFIPTGDFSECEVIVSELNEFQMELDFASEYATNRNLESRFERAYSNINEMILFFENYGGISSEYLLWGNILKSNKRAVVNFCPKRIDMWMKENIFEREISTIGLSATITVNNSYNYIRESIGFVGDTDSIYNSPFPYENSRLFIPRNLPNYSNRDDLYFKKIGELIVETVKYSTGGNLVLFTAKDDLKQVANYLKQRLTCPIYVDGEECSQKEILNDFKETGGIILGTGVFWEGIDLKGNLLTNVIIVRLPFPVPDPVVEYKISKNDNIREAVLVPEMITKLKQGSGRLIRSMKDVGCLTILDSRMNQTRYKNRDLILQSLPFKNCISDFEELERFQRSLCMLDNGK